MNGEIMAEFLLFKDSENDYNWVKVIPYIGATMEYIRNTAHPIWGMLMPGMQMTQDGFLGLITICATEGKKSTPGYELTMQSADGKTYFQIRLRPGVKASDISGLTGWPIKYIRQFYKDYFVIDTEGTD